MTLKVYCKKNFVLKLYDDKSGFDPADSCPETEYHEGACCTDLNLMACPFLSYDAI